MTVERILLGHAAVDSGQLIIVDPCYIEDGLDYEAVCKVTLEASRDEQGGPYLARGIAGFGVVTSTGFGDGNYPVYAEVVDKGDGWGQRVASVTVEFLPHPVLGD